MSCFINLSLSLEMSSFMKLFSLIIIFILKFLLIIQTILSYSSKLMIFPPILLFYLPTLLNLLILCIGNPLEHIDYLTICKIINVIMSQILSQVGVLLWLQVQINLILSPIPFLIQIFFFPTSIMSLPFLVIHNPLLLLRQ